MSTAPHHRTTDEIVLETLQSVRNLVGMEVAFISEFTGGRRVFRYVNQANDELPVCVGAGDPLEDSYCQRVVDGRLPELLHNARECAEALRLPVTEALPVGAHLSVPIRLSDGQVYGTFCCFSRKADYALTERDLGIMRCFADLAARFLEEQIVRDRQHDALLARHQGLLQHERFMVVYQPIVDLAENHVAGYEALTRFQDLPLRGPDVWFEEAAQVGLQQELELAAMRKALRGLPHLPADAYLSLNASPDTMLGGALHDLLTQHPCERLMLEVTEHASVEDYAAVADALEPLRRRGLKLAVDDAGAGYASFRHILKLRPDVIKLDTSLIRRIDADRGYRALAAALVRFAEQTGSKVVAEGVETEAELAVLRELRVDKVQGYLLGRPAPLESLPGCTGVAA